MRAERGAEPRAPAPEAEAEHLTIVEAARLTGVSRGTITGWIAGGYLPTRRVDRQRRIQPGDLVTAHAVIHAKHVEVIGS
jgi:excisionase family DNA binding protein